MGLTHNRILWGGAEDATDSAVVGMGCAVGRTLEPTQGLLMAVGGGQAIGPSKALRGLATERFARRVVGLAREGDGVAWQITAASVDSDK